MAAVVVKGKKGEEELTRDEHPRDTTIEILKKLKPVFRKNGTGRLCMSSVFETLLADLSLSS